MIELTRRVVRKVRARTGTLLVVSMTPEGLWLREYRQRHAFLLPFALAHQYAVRISVEAMRAEKARAKHARQR